MGSAAVAVAAVASCRRARRPAVRRRVPVVRRAAAVVEAVAVVAAADCSARTRPVRPPAYMAGKKVGDKLFSDLFTLKSDIGNQMLRQTTIWTEQQRRRSR